MIKYQKDMSTRTVESLRNGNGPLSILDIFSPSETGNLTNLCSVISIPPGHSIGHHAHTEDGELYYILEGELVVKENEDEFLLKKGDSSFAVNGVAHSVENRGNQTAKLLAIIIPK